MANPSIDALEDGDGLTAASLNTRLASLAGAANDVETDAVAEEAFRNFHMPSLAPAISSNPTVAQATNGATHNYTNVFPTWTAIAPAGLALEIILTKGFTLGQVAPDWIRGIVVLANVHLWDIRDSFAPTTSIDRDNLAAFALQWRDELGAWHTIVGSLCSVSQDNTAGTVGLVAAAGAEAALPKVSMDVPLLGYIDEDALGAHTVDRIRAVVACADGAGTTWAGTRQITLRECRISAFGLHAGG